jgi:hypothetical protein
MAPRSTKQTPPPKPEKITVLCHPGVDFGSCFPKTYDQETENPIAASPSVVNTIGGMDWPMIDRACCRLATVSDIQDIRSSLY